MHLLFAQEIHDAQEGIVLVLRLLREGFQEGFQGGWVIKKGIGALGCFVPYRRFFVHPKTRVKKLRAFGADAMTENGFRMFGEIILDLIPSSLVIPDALASGTDGQEALQDLDFGESQGKALVGTFQVPVQFLKLLLVTIPNPCDLAQLGLRCSLRSASTMVRSGVPSEGRVFMKALSCSKPLDSLMAVRPGCPLE
jgi:hypothetical protein